MKNKSDPNVFEDSAYIAFSEMLINAIDFAESRSLDWETVLITGTHHLIQSSCGYSQSDVLRVTTAVLCVLEAASRERASISNQTEARNNISVNVQISKTINTKDCAGISEILGQTKEILAKLSWKQRWH